MNSFESIKKLRENIVKQADKKTSDPILIGVSGGVACGKSRLVAQLIKELNDLPEKFHPVHISFDYWINKKGLNSSALLISRFGCVPGST
jgi:pantothenate kinase